MSPPYKPLPVTVPPLVPATLAQWPVTSPHRPRVHVRRVPSCSPAPAPSTAPSYCTPYSTAPGSPHRPRLGPQTQSPDVRRQRPPDYAPGGKSRRNKDADRRPQKGPPRKISSANWRCFAVRHLPDGTEGYPIGRPASHIPALRWVLWSTCLPSIDPINAPGLQTPMPERTCRWPIHPQKQYWPVVPSTPATSCRPRPRPADHVLPSPRLHELDTQTRYSLTPDQANSPGREGRPIGRPLQHPLRDAATPPSPRFRAALRGGHAAALAAVRMSVKSVAGSVKI